MRWVRRLRSIACAVATAVCLGLLTGGLTSPAWSAGQAEPSPAELGAFAIGDGLEAVLDERDGSLRFALRVGGIELGWDSRALPDDRHGIGPGWAWAVGHIETRGGVRVSPPSGGRSYSADPISPSGLAGYPTEDLLFVQERGRLPARDGVDAERDVAFRLHELGGTTRWYSEAGDPIASTDAHGNRVDWLWHASVPHRLLGVVDAAGVQIALDWASEPGAVLVREAVNVGPGVAVGDRQPGRGDVIWRLELDGGRLARVTDAVGGATRFATADDGLLERVAAPSGAVTDIAWHAFEDGAPRARRVHTTDGTGRELSTREWNRLGAATSSGWPLRGAAGPGGSTAESYSTVLSDGVTRIVSEYNAGHLLTERSMVVVTPSGERQVQTREFVYPGTEDGGMPDPEALPPNWSRPVETTSIVHDGLGGTRRATETFVFDEFGRSVERRTSAGDVSTREYDPGPPDAEVPPVGLPTREHSVTADGLTKEIRYELNEARTAAVRVEAWSGARDEPPVRSARNEFEIGADGEVVEERVFPAGDPDATPITTRWERQVDLVAGTMLEAEIAGVGTPDEVRVGVLASIRAGGAARSTDAMGNQAFAITDAGGRVIEQIDAAGRTVTTAHETSDRDGRNATVVTVAGGLAAVAERDALGRIVRVTDNVDHGRIVPGFERIAERRAYPSAGVTEITDAWGATMRTVEDVLGRVVEQVGVDGVVQRADYDDVAMTVTTRVEAPGDPSDVLLTTTRQLDERGNTVAETAIRADGLPAATAVTAYDGFDRPVSASNGVASTNTTYDVSGNPVLTTVTPERGSASALRAERRFDAFGRSIEKTLVDETGSRSGGTREFDALGRQVLVIDQAGRATGTEYTPDGLVARVEAGSGQVTELTHDPVTRELLHTRVSSPVGPDVVSTFGYDPVTGDVVTIADGEGRAMLYTYDAHGNVLEVRYPDDRTIGHEYDRHGRLETTTNTAGFTTRYRYDGAGRVTSAEQIDPDREPVASVDYDYDRFGRLVRLERGNGVVTETEFTSLNQIAAERTTRGDELVSERGYSYDPDGNLTGRTDRPGRDAARLTEYTYDAFDRLTTSTVHAGETADTAVVRTREYTFTVSGDVRTETTSVPVADGSLSRSTREFEYSPLGELVAIATDGRRQSQAYDSAGNLTQGADGSRYSYDAANRLLSQVTGDGSTLDTAYWPQGRRRQLTATDAGGAVRTSRFHWDHDGTLLDEAHTSEAGTSGTASYLLAGQRLARTTSAPNRTSTTYAGTDRHDNVTELTDSSGVVLERRSYSDYGVPERLGAAPVDPLTGGVADPVSLVGEVEYDPFGHAGEYTDPTGDQLLGDRHYRPAMLQFTTRDTAELHNSYAYGDLNPITKVDPTGFSAQDDITRSVVGLVMSIVSFAANALTGGTASIIATGFALVFTALMSAAELLNGEEVFEFGTFRMDETTSEVLGGVALVLGLLSGVVGGGRAVAKTASDAGATYTRLVERATELGSSPRKVAPRYPVQPRPGPVTTPTPTPTPKPTPVPLDELALTKVELELPQLRPVMLATQSVPGRPGDLYHHLALVGVVKRYPSGYERPLPPLPAEIVVYIRFLVTTSFRDSGRIERTISMYEVAMWDQFSDKLFMGYMCSLAEDVMKLSAHDVKLIAAARTNPSVMHAINLDITSSMVTVDWPNAKKLLDAERHGRNWIPVFKHLFGDNWA